MAAVAGSASSPWLNLVERWLAELTNNKLRRGAHRCVRDLNTDIKAWTTTWNDDQILESITRYRTPINELRH
jgi:hypothetical protein